MRTFTFLALLTLLCLAAPALATTTKPGTPPTTETIDCKKDNNTETCIECGAGGMIACCYGDDCTVTNKPKKIYLNPLPPVGPIKPWHGSGWQIL